MKSKIVKMYDAYEVFDKVKQKFGKDIEGAINEIYNPPCSGAYQVYIPAIEEQNEDGYDLVELQLFNTLLDEPDIHPGDFIWIEVDY